MKTEKKFFLDPIDGLEVAKECIADSEGSLAILNIPKDSVLNASAQNFKEIKKIAGKEHKEIVIESPDERVLEFAEIAGIRTVNTSYRSRERAVSDILPAGRKMTHSFPEKPQEDEYIPASPEEKKRPDISIIFEKKQEAEERKKRSEEKGRSLRFFSRKKKVNKEPEEITSFEEEVKEIKEKKRGKRKNRTIIFLSFVAVILLGIWASITFLPKATVILTLKKVSVPFEETLVVSVSATSPITTDKEKTTIPGELISAKKNMLLEFEAETREEVSYKAKGTLIVSNAYSTSPQTLVATTRFESPDGKIFRLDEKTTIPGAKISAGKITPSSAEVKVTADAAGEEWNLPPTKNWKIPGFKGTPRYDAFIVENTRAMSGGFVGEAPVISDAQKESAEKNAQQSLKDVLNGEMFVLMSDDFKLLPEAERFEIIKSEFQTIRDAPNKLGIFVEGEMKRIVFEAQTAEDALFRKYGSSYIEEGYTALKSFEIEYGTSTLDLVNKTMSVPIRGSITYTFDLEQESLKEEFKGKEDAELRRIIFSLPGIENATISLWPFWVNRVPDSARRFLVEIK